MDKSRAARFAATTNTICQCTSQFCRTSTRLAATSTTRVWYCASQDELQQSYTVAVRSLQNNQQRMGQYRLQLQQDDAIQQRLQQLGKRLEQQQQLK
jgi:hypothetical protein